LSQQILRRHVNDATTRRAVDIRNEKKCYCGNHQARRQHGAQILAGILASRAYLPRILAPVQAHAHKIRKESTSIRKGESMRRVIANILFLPATHCRAWQVSGRQGMRNAEGAQYIPVPSA
jgi:hypothetical protein